MSYLIKINNLNKKNIKNKINFLEKNKSNTMQISTLPTQYKKFTVLRSPHVDKKAREQYELRKYKILIKINKISKNNIQDLLKKDAIFVKIKKII